MPERVCPRDDCGYQVSDHSGTARSHNYPSDCPTHGDSLVPPSSDDEGTEPDSEDGDLPAEVIEFAEENGMDPERVAAQRGED